MKCHLSHLEDIISRIIFILPYRKAECRGVRREKCHLPSPFPQLPCLTILLTCSHMLGDGECIIFWKEFPNILLGTFVSSIPCRGKTFIQTWAVPPHGCGHEKEQYPCRDGTPLTPARRAGLCRLSLGPSPNTKDCCLPEHSFLGFTVRCVVMVTPARL